MNEQENGQPGNDLSHNSLKEWTKQDPAVRECEYTWCHECSWVHQNMNSRKN